jgi:hypothetical protein
MHKSALTFGLLASSLVMLAIMPFLYQNNSFSNVMAQEYDKYGDSSYSQYPTDDKKYECQTGPFESFFVSSVEFCKHVNFDDRKDHSRDNRTGTQGPPGPQGIQGERGFNGTQGIQGERGFNGTQGIQGERGFNGTAGPSQILPGALYEVNGPPTVTGPFFNSVAESHAECDEGDIVFNGESFVSPLANTSVLTGISSFEAVGSNHSEWIVQVQGSGIQLFAKAICFDNPPPH